MKAHNIYRYPERHGVNGRNLETLEHEYKRSLAERGAQYAECQREQDAVYSTRQHELNQDVRRHLSEG